MVIASGTATLVGGTPVALVTSNATQGNFVLRLQHSALQSPGMFVDVRSKVAVIGGGDELPRTPHRLVPPLAVPSALETAITDATWESEPFRSEHAFSISLVANDAADGVEMDWEIESLK